MPRNPCHRTELERAVPGRKKVVLERPESWLIHDHMRDDMQDMIETAVGTAMRFGDITALIDLGQRATTC